MTLFERVHLPSFAGATEWLNSEPLGPAELRGRVVLVNFWTWTCINWLRQEPYVRAWSQAYRDDGLIVIGVHTPEFAFEHDIDGVRRATRSERSTTRSRSTTTTRSGAPSPTTTGRRCTSPTATASSATSTSAKDATRSSERVIQQLLGVERELVSVEGARRGGGGRLGPPAHARDLPRLLAQRAVRVWIASTIRPGGPAPEPLGARRRVDDQDPRRRARPGRREHRLPVPRARRAPRDLSRSARADPLPRAPRRRGSRPVTRRRRRRRTATAYSETTACTSSCASTTSSATERWRSRFLRARCQGVRVHVRIARRDPDQENTHVSHATP